MVEHEALKIRLAEEHGTDVSAYTAGKGASSPACWRPWVFSRDAADAPPMKPYRRDR